MVDEQNDAELIERARDSISRLMNYGECHDGDVDGAACLLEQLADRLAKLTTPEPWRPPSELPETDVHAWVRIDTDEGPRVYESRRAAGEKWPWSATGWKTIVRPMP